MASGGENVSAMLVELSVVLVVNQNDPSIINPDFLRFNGIIDAAFQTVGSPISTPMFSQAVFEGGLSIRAEPNRFIFEQKGQNLNENSCIVPGIAERFLNKVSHVSYTAIGINPKGLKLSNDKIKFSVADMLSDGGKWVSFRDVRPDIQLKAIFQYESRKVTLDISGVEAKRNIGSTSSGLLFSANFHRDINESSQNKRLEKALTILTEWKGDISDFNSLVQKFNTGEDSV